MKHQPISDEALEKLLKEKLFPVTPNWETNRSVLEAILLKDEKTVLRSRRDWIRYSWMGAMALAAALVLTFTLFFPDSPLDSNDIYSDPSKIAPVQLGSQAIANSLNGVQMEYRAVGARNKLIGMEDRGWKQLDDDSVSREFKYDYVDTIDLVNEQDGSVIRLEVPRQEIVNVTYQVI